MLRALNYGVVSLVFVLSVAAFGLNSRLAMDLPLIAAELSDSAAGAPETLTIAAPGVMLNDSDVEGAALETIVVTAPANGTLTLNLDGSFTYTPHENFYGTDTFRYRAREVGRPASGDGANVTITVHPVNRDGVSTSATATVTVAVRSPTTTTLASSASGTTPTYGTAVTLTATVTLAGTNTPATAGNVEFFDNGRLLGSSVVNAAGIATLTTTGVNAGTRSLTAAYHGATLFVPSLSAPISQTINKAVATGTFLTLSPVQRQYSDKVLFEATVSPATSAESVTFQIGALVLGTVPVVNGKASASLPITAPPGSRIVTAVFNSANYTIANAAKSLSIVKEDARVTYSGPATVSLAGQASVAITVTVSDITAIDPLADPDAGDIGTATVTFVNRATPASYGTYTVVANADRKAGTATFQFPASALGTAASQTITFGFIVSGNYNRNSTSDNAVLTITR